MTGILHKFISNYSFSYCYSSLEREPFRGSTSDSTPALSPPSVASSVRLLRSRANGRWWRGERDWDIQFALICSSPSSPSVHPSAPLTHTRPWSCVSLWSVVRRHASLRSTSASKLEPGQIALRYCVYQPLLFKGHVSVVHMPLVKGHMYFRPFVAVP